MKTAALIILMFLPMKLAIAQQVDIYKRPVQAERSRDFDAIHYKITLNVDIDKKMLTGENQITLSPLNDNFEKCVFDAEYLVVENVIDSDGQYLPFEQKDNQCLSQFKETV